jgi:Iap family predicted aminopeptidase
MDDRTRAALFSELDFERLAGTPGEARAMEILRRVLRGMGMEPAVEEFPVHTFHTGTARLECGAGRWDLHPYGLQGNCVMEGELRFVDNPDVLAFNTDAYRGCILLSYGSGPRVHDLLFEGGVRALVEISGAHREAASISHRQKRYEDGKAVPSMTARYADAAALAALHGKKVRIEVRQEVSRATAHNLVFTMGAPVKDRTLTYLVAHYDSVSRSHGSVDNAAGVIALLGVVDELRAMRLERELRVVLFSAEELGLRGSWAHVKMHEEEIRSRGRLAVNLDLGGDPVGADCLFVTGTKELMGWAAGVCREDGLVMREILDIYSSDNMPFAVEEIPSISIARVDGQGSFYIHTPQDVAANVSPAGVANTTRAARSIVGRLMQAAVYPLRKEIDDSFREKIEKYVWTSTLEKPELRWMEKYRK